MIYKTQYSYSRKGISYKILEKMYFKNSFTRHFFYSFINRFEGSQFYSTSLRRIFHDHFDINVGIGSYGCFTDGFRPHVTIGNYCSIAPG